MSTDWLLKRVLSRDRTPHAPQKKNKMRTLHLSINESQQNLRGTKCGGESEMWSLASVARRRRQNLHMGPLSSIRQGLVRTHAQRVNIPQTPTRPRRVPTHQRLPAEPRAANRQKDGDGGGRNKMRRKSKAAVFKRNVSVEDPPPPPKKTAIYFALSCL